MLLLSGTSCFTRERTFATHKIGDYSCPTSTLPFATTPPGRDEVDPSESVASIPSNAQTGRFHQDMKRILESRAAAGGVGDMAKASIMERRKRPEVLDDDKDGVCRVLTMLDRMIQLELATEETFQIVMRACLRRGRLRWRNQKDGLVLPQIICAADQLEYLLFQLRAISSNVSLPTYQLVLKAYATCSTPRGGRNYAKRAEKLLRRMQDDGVLGPPNLEDLGQENSIPVETLTHVLHAWAWQQANLRPGDCAERASDYLEQIENSPENVDTEHLLQCYDWVLEAWSKSGSNDAAHQADQIFEKFKELNRTQTASTILNTQSYSNAILAWSKNKEAGSAQRADDLLVEMLDNYHRGAFPASEPELIAFNGVITAWAKLGNPEKAAGVLWLMEDVQTKCKDLVTDVVTYNTVLHSHVMSSNKTEALREIQKIVNFMEDNSVDQPAIAPDSFTYNTLMKAWIKSGESDLAQQSEQILRKMETLWQRGDDRVEPTKRHFNVVMNAYAKSCDPFASRKALDLLQRMKEGSFHSKPDIISYTSAIECFSRSADPKASETVLCLLDEAFASHEETGDPAMRPNLRTFTMVILTLANCNGSIVVARNLLTRLVGLYEETRDEALMPNTYPYNYVLNCAANTIENKLQAFRLATQTYQEMRESKYTSPDSYTYAFWLKCCNNLLKENKDLKSKCMFYAFDECRKEGLVSNTVLNRLQRGIPPTTLEEWLGVPKRKSGFWDLKVNELPAEWSCNSQS